MGNHPWPREKDFMKLTPEKHATPLGFFLATNRREIKWSVLFSFFYVAAMVSMLVTNFYTGRIIDQLQNGSSGVGWSIAFIILGVVGYEVGFRIGHLIEIYTFSRIRSNLKKVLF